MTTKFGMIVFRKAQLYAEFHCTNSAVTLFSKDGKGESTPPRLQKAKNTS